MLIPDAFLTSKIWETNDFKEYETVFMKVAVPMNQLQPVISTQGTNRNTPRDHRSPTIFANPLEMKKRKQTAKESSSPRKSLKITIKQKQIVEKDDDDSEDRIKPENRANDIVLQEALRCKFEKSSPSITSCMEDDFHSQHDEHQEDDAPLEGEKRVKRSKKSKRSKSTRDEVIPEDETPKLIAEFHNIDKRVPTIFDHTRMEATLRDTLSNQYKNAKEYAYHLEQSTNFMENQIVWERRQQDIPHIVPKTPIFYGSQRNPNEPPRLMYMEIVKFYAATLEKVLKGVKHRMFESKFLKKLPMLGDLDQDIMKAYEREISM
ncbi:hypothetical protein Tco_0932931, partial [Tanacetum coccineum]